jgi:hypothetical protein
MAGIQKTQNGINNMNQIKLNTTRNTSGILVVKVLVNDELIFATSSGHQLACAMHQFGIDSFVQLRSELLNNNENPEDQVSHFNEQQAIQDQIFWYYALVGFVQMQSRKDLRSDAEYLFVASHLPPHLVRERVDATELCSESARGYFNQFVSYPSVTTC